MEMSDSVAHLAQCQKCGSLPSSSSFPSQRIQSQTQHTFASTAIGDRHQRTGQLANNS